MNGGLSTRYIRVRLGLWSDRFRSFLSSIELTPIQITIIYTVVAFAGLYFSDVYLPKVINNPELLIRDQAIKGAVEILVTAGLIFTLSSRGRRKLQLKNERLEQLQAERSVLHRVFRHNLRQDLNLIQGYSAEIQSAIDGTSHQTEFQIIVAAADRIDRNIDSVLKFESLLESESDLESIDLASIITDDEMVIAAMESETVDLTISVPDMVRVWAHPQVREAFHEVLENAIKHSNQAKSNVEVTVERTSTGAVKLIVTDDGPHIPTHEIVALERMEEQPITHSDGLGLWYAKLAATMSGGDLSIQHLEGGGNEVSIIFH